MDWEQEFLKLKAEGKTKEAVALLKPAIESGSLSAKVRYAIEYREVGLTIDEADRLVDEVLQKVEPDDAVTHWHLSQALELLFSTMEPDQKHIESFKHLLIAAQVGGAPEDCYAVGIFYHYGGRGVKASHELALHWYDFAKKGGHRDADLAIQEIVAVKP